MRLGRHGRGQQPCPGHAPHSDPHGQACGAAKRGSLLLALFLPKPPNQPHSFRLSVQPPPEPRQKGKAKQANETNCPLCPRGSFWRQHVGQAPIRRPPFLSGPPGSPPGRDRLLPNSLLSPEPLATPQRPQSPARLSPERLSGAPCARQVPRGPSGSSP